MAHVSVVAIDQGISCERMEHQWRLSARRESEIVTRAAICHSTRQQREPLKNATGTESEDWSDDDEVLDGDENDDASICVAGLNRDNAKSIKMALLDRMAEILCNKKHASHVTCTNMVEHADRITLLAARNARWTKKDIKLLEDVACAMEQISSRATLPNGELATLYGAIANHYIPRLRHHVTSLMVLLKQHEVANNFFDQGRHFIEGKLSALEIVKQANIAAADPAFRMHVRDLGNESASGRIIDELQCVRRPRVAYDTICQAAGEVDGFHNVEIRLLSGYPPKKVALCEEALPRERSSKLTGHLNGRKWVHAEIRMVTYLLSHNIFYSAFPYLGLSKKTCLLCGLIIQRLARFNTRSNHGKIYSQWTVPPMLQLSETSIEHWEGAVEHVQDTLRAEAVRSNIPSLQALKESTVRTPVAPQYDRSSVFTSHVDDPRLRQRDAMWLSSFSRIEVPETKCDLEDLMEDAQDVPEIQGLEAQMSDPFAAEREQSKNSFCSHCHESCEGALKCLKCNSAYYCCLDCRTEDWIDHKFDCRLGRPIDEADYLVRSCCRKKYPEKDDEVAKAFGFLHFIAAPERLKLFDIYCKLINVGGIGDDELREAWRTNRLKECILYRGSQLPPHLIEDNLRWFRAQEGFAANSVAGSGTMMESVRDILGSRQVDELESLEEQHACIFYFQVRNGYVPDVDEDNWLDLGFCTSETPGQCVSIFRAYTDLIKLCTFEDFWQAMRDSSMVELFRKCGFASQIARLSNFETLMQTVGKWHQSVWELKRFTLMEDPEPTRSVTVDYGFQNCKKVHDRSSLRESYQRYFAMGLDAMELHQACIDGNLSAFLRSKLGELSVPSELFSNPYPLDQCKHMGMVAKRVVMCSESDYSLVCESLRARGDNSVVCTIPDSCDDGMTSAMKDRAAHVTGKLRVSKEDFRDCTLVSLSCE